MDNDKELKQIGKFAWKCFGLFLPDSVILDIFLLSKGEFVFTPRYLSPQIMQRIAKGWLEIKPFKEGL